MQVCAAVRRELARVARTPVVGSRSGEVSGPWLVADMDSTLIRKDAGEWPDLDASPAKAGLVRWLKLGGRLLVVTSDEGHRPFRQLLAQIRPQSLWARVLLSK